MSAEFPHIDAGNKNLKVVSAEAWAALQRVNSPPFLFRSGAIPLRLEKNEDGATVSRQLYAYKLRHELSRAAEWTVTTRTEVKPALPPMHVVQDMLAWTELPLPPLDRIVSTPVFSADGTLQYEKGYYPESKAYLDPTVGLILRPVSKKPSGDELQEALNLILIELLGEFPFTELSDKANAVAFLLLPFARELIKGPTPLHLFEAPSPGTGKGLVVEVLTFPSLGRSAPIMTEGGNEEEWRKRITAKLITKPTIILVDNLQQRLDSPSLAGVLTSTIWDDRVLGGSVIASLAVKCVWAATGNNPILSHEITRRSIRIRMDANVDRPWLRNGFRHPDLRSWVSENRGNLIWACLTLIQSWIAAAPPPWKRVTLGMYDAWTKVMGGILENCGIKGFLDNLNSFYDIADAEGASLRMLVKLWWEKYEDSLVGVSELFDLNDFLDEPIELGKGSDRSRRTKMGQELVKLRDRRFDGLRVVQAGEKNRGKQWKLVVVAGTSSTDSEPMNLNEPKTAPSDNLQRAVSEPSEPNELFEGPQEVENTCEVKSFGGEIGSQGSAGSSGGGLK